jgi:dUTP pyrophosphatase
VSWSPVLKFKKLHETSIIPSYATEGAACFDFFACLYPFKAVKVYSVTNELEEIKLQYNFLVIEPGDRILIPTGVCADIPEGHCIKIYSRSGLSLKHGLLLTNGVGVIDSDYTDEIFVSMTNNSADVVILHTDNRIAQGELVTYRKTNIELVESSDFQTLPQKGNRIGGFGSTGV